MLCPPKLLRENFPNDREYTLQSLVEQLGLMELHIRDGSWRLCDCNPEKHLPLVAGLASEGFGFAENDDEREFMECLMNQARLFRGKIRRGEYVTQDDMDRIRAWAREARHRIEARDWTVRQSGGEPLSPEQREILKKLEGILKSIREERAGDAKHGQEDVDLLRMEREMAERALDELSSRYGVSKPELVISDRCHDPEKGGYAEGKILMCRSGVSLHVLAHEFWHHVQAERGLHLDEGEAERFAVGIFKHEPQKGLYAKHGNSNSGEKMVKTLKEKLKNVAVIYGGQHIGNAIERILIWADTQRPEGLLGHPVSLWGDILGTIGGLAGALYLKAPWDFLAALIGGHMSTDLLRFVELPWPAASLVAAPVATAPTGLVYAPPAAPAVSATTPSAPAIRTTRVVAPQGRYSVTG